MLECLLEFHPDGFGALACEGVQVELDDLAECSEAGSAHLFLGQHVDDGLEHDWFLLLLVSHVLAQSIVPSTLIRLSLTRKAIVSAIE